MSQNSSLCMWHIGKNSSLSDLLDPWHCCGSGLLFKSDMKKCCYTLVAMDMISRKRQEVYNSLIS